MRHFARVSWVDPRRGLCLLGLWCVVACAGLAPGPSRLSAVDPPATGPRPITLGVGPVRFASPSGSGVSEEDFARVLRQDLLYMIPAREVVELPLRGGPATDYRLSMDVHRFERRSDGVVALEARWSLWRGAHPVPLTTRRSYVFEGAESGTTSAALSEVLRRLCTEITDVVVRDSYDPAPLPVGGV